MFRFSFGVFVVVLLFSLARFFAIKLFDVDNVGSAEVCFRFLLFRRPRISAVSLIECLEAGLFFSLSDDLPELVDTDDEPDDAELDADDGDSDCESDAGDDTDDDDDDGE